MIEGDLATEDDARRIRAAGAPAVQITTGNACHLDAAMIHDALHSVLLAPIDVDPVVIPGHVGIAADQLVVDELSLVEGVADHELVVGGEGGHELVSAVKAGTNPWSAVKAGAIAVVVSMSSVPMSG